MFMSYLRPYRLRSNSTSNAGIGIVGSSKRGLSTTHLPPLVKPILLLGFPNLDSSLLTPTTGVICI